MSILIFAIVLSLLVFVHELGHFLAAKWAKLRVDEFAVGFPPRLLSWKRGETTYALNAIPFGGYVKIHGENPDEESISGADSARSMVNAPRWKQIIVLIAGVVFNIVFAWLLISVSFMFGVSSPITDTNLDRYISDTRTVVVGLTPDGPADMAGIEVGDEIAMISAGNNTQLEQLNTEGLRQFIVDNQEPLEIVLADANDSIFVEPVEGIVPDARAVGVVIETLGTMRLPIHKALWHGVKQTGVMTGQVAYAFGDLIAGAFRGDAKLSSLTGPVGLVGLVGDATRIGITYLFVFTALISLNLAVLNILPFPALDGGRIAVVIAEGIRGKRFPSGPLNIINLVGFIILIGLILVVTWHDVMRLF